MQAGGTEQGQDDHHHHCHTLPREGGGWFPFQPVVEYAMAEARQRVLVSGFSPIQLGALQQDRLDALVLQSRFIV